MSLDGVAAGDAASASDLVIQMAYDDLLEAQHKAERARRGLDPPVTDGHTAGTAGIERRQRLAAWSAGGGGGVDGHRARVEE